MRARLYFLCLLLCQLSFAQVPRFNVTMTAADYESLYTRDIFSDVYLPAVAEYRDTVWNNALTRFKGNSTRYFPKKSFRLRFSTSNLFQGMRQFNLNSMYTDKSFIREKLAWDLFADMGALAPEAYHAELAINGEYKGVFAWIDKVDRYFLQRRNRILAPMYDTDDFYSLADLTIQPDSLLRLYYPKEVGDESDYSDLRSLIEAINNASDSSFATMVDNLFDMNSVLNWFAGNTLMMMGDTYNKNYLLYRDTSRVTQQWVIIPWDYDLSFGRNGDPAIPYPASLLNEGFAYTFSPLSGPSNVLKDRFLNTPSLVNRLRARLDTIMTTTFTEKRMYPRIDSLASLVQFDVLRDPEKWGTYQDFLDHVGTLKYYVTARRNYLYKTFINPPSGQYNTVTLQPGQLGAPLHFVAFDGRQIATMWFTSFSGLDSIRIRVYPDSTPPGVINPGDQRFIMRWMNVIPFPPNATFAASIQWMYEDITLLSTERGTGVQDERLLRGYDYDGINWNQIPTTINPIANTATMESISQEMVGSGRHFALLLPQTYTQTWFRQPFFFWQRWHDIRFANPQLGYIVGEHGTLLRTANGGTSWSEHPIGINLSFYKLHVRSVDTLFAVGDFGSLYRSIDSGSVWARITVPTTRDLRSIVFPTPQVGWVAGDGTVFRTTDGGASWSTLLTDSTRSFYDVAAFGQNDALVLGSNGSAFATTNAGATWQLRSTGSSKHIYASVTSGSSTVWAVGDSGLVLQSTNRGINWTNVSAPTVVPLRGISLINSQSLFVSGNSGTIFYTTNGGANWYSQYTADSHDLNAVAFLDSSHGYAVGNGGTILTTTSAGTVTGVALAGSLPDEFKLFQNYPNPFNPQTTIEYAVPKAGLATLKIYNILGQEVATLLNERLNEGRHQMQWNGRNVASGVYFYRLILAPSDGSASLNQTKKMLLIK